MKSVVARNLTDVNGTLFFRATSGFLHKVWKSDGTTAGTTVLSMDGNDVRELANVAGTLFFSGDFQSHGLRPQLWKSDGTTAGTVLMKDLPEGTTVPFGAYGALPHERKWETILFGGRCIARHRALEERWNVFRHRSRACQ